MEYLRLRQLGRNRDRRSWHCAVSFAAPTAIAISLTMNRPMRKSKFCEPKTNQKTTELILKI
ncbi:MAG: hypothetical protein QNJ34_20885 [Xenococcaceae cyanobacterium MO_188.B29]|nr:hypothetical protein [Xenococcaceae cyanobacterium MO_188.B29]